MCGSCAANEMIALDGTGYIGWALSYLNRVLFSEET